MNNLVVSHRYVLHLCSRQIRSHFGSRQICKPYLSLFTFYQVARRMGAQRAVEDRPWPLSLRPPHLLVGTERYSRPYISRASLSNARIPSKASASCLSPPVPLPTPKSLLRRQAPTRAHPTQPSSSREEEFLSMLEVVGRVAAPAQTLSSLPVVPPAFKKARYSDTATTRSLLNLRLAGLLERWVTVVKQDLGLASKLFLVTRGHEDAAERMKLAVSEYSPNTLSNYLGAWKSWPQWCVCVWFL